MKYQAGRKVAFLSDPTARIRSVLGQRCGVAPEIPAQVTAGFDAVAGISQSELPVA